MKKENVILSLTFIIILSVFSFISAESSQTSVEFTTGTYTCESNATSATWIKSDTNQRFNVPSQANCSAFYHESVPSCCPTLTNHCNTTSGTCVDSSRITDCTKYLNQDDCIHDDQHVGLSSIANSSICGVSSVFELAGESCVNHTQCGCYWENSKCSAKIKYNVNCTGGGGRHLGDCTYSTFSSTNEDCSNPAIPITIRSTATWIQGTQYPSMESCKNVTRTYPCVSTAQLPFFTLSSFITSLLIVVFIYSILLHIKKR